jgi:NAD(P)-dependent dehydrogenase (short-subunit alcohol dehydrogenase family)
MIDRLFDLGGKTAVVTGGSSGIGFALAEALARAGVRVAIVNRTRKTGEGAAQKLSSEGREVRAFCADVTDLGQVEAMAEAVESQMGPIEILVNSHGINIRKDALHFPPEEWNEILAINLTGTFYTCQAVGKRMTARGTGRVVNVSSIGSLVGLENRAAYCASKGGVTQLTKVLAMEWAARGVRVNAIGPGFIRTPLIDALLQSPGFDERVKTLVPCQRVGETHDLVGLVLLLCSRAADYITGQTIYVDGGWSIS